MPLVTLDHVSKTFTDKQGTERHAVKDVSLTIERGDILGIIGLSGAGKSTLVRLVNALETPTAGHVIVDDRDITQLSSKELRLARRNIGMVFQQFNLFESRTIAANVAYPLTIAKVPKVQRDAKVAKLLDFVGLLDRAYDYPNQLSGGQKQRVGIARALANDPQLLLADEATSALDPTTTREVLQLLKRVNSELGVTILLITHGISVIRELATHVAVMTDGQVVEYGSVYDVFADPQQPITSTFVSTAVSGRPDRATLERLKAQHPGTIISFPIVEGHPRHVDQAALYAVLARHGVLSTTLYGGVGELQGRAIGSLTLGLTGEDADVAAAISELTLAFPSAVEETLTDDTSGGETPVGPTPVDGTSVEETRA